MSRERRRRYTIMSLSLARDVVEMIEDFARLTGWYKRRCVEELVRYAHPELKKRLVALKAKRAEEEEERGDEEERLREEYWRKVFTGQIKANEWEQEWWGF